MIEFKKIAPVFALSLVTALAGTGCMAQNDDETTTDQDIAAAAPDQESTGEAKDACGINGVGGLGAYSLWSSLSATGVDGFSVWANGLGCGLGSVGRFWPGGCGFGAGLLGLSLSGFGGCGGFGGGFGGCGGCW